MACLLLVAASHAADPAPNSTASSDETAANSTASTHAEKNITLYHVYSRNGTKYVPSYKWVEDASAEMFTFNMTRINDFMFPIGDQGMVIGRRLADNVYVCVDSLWLVVDAGRTGVVVSFYAVKGALGDFLFQWVHASESCYCNEAFLRMLLWIATWGMLSLKTSTRFYGWLAARPGMKNIMPARGISIFVYAGLFMILYSTAAHPPSERQNNTNVTRFYYYDPNTNVYTKYLVGSICLDAFVTFAWVYVDAPSIGVTSIVLDSVVTGLFWMYEPFLIYSRIFLLCLIGAYAVTLYVQDYLRRRQVKQDDDHVDTPHPSPRAAGDGQ